MSTIFATFRSAEAAQKAAGALLDHGALEADLSVVSHDTATASVLPPSEGFTTTTSADVAVGAVKGAATGASLGLLAALATLFIPGVGWVLGGGALATALAGAVGATAAGVAAGGVVGYLKDQGIDEEHVTRYSNAFNEGYTILSIAVPSGDLEASDAEGILAKYGAVNVGTFQRHVTPVVAPAIDTAHPPVPVVPVDHGALAQSTRIDIDQIAVTDTGQVVTPAGTTDGTVVPTPTGHQVVVARTPATNDPLEPTTTIVVDPVTGVRRSVTVDPVTGIETIAVVDPITGKLIETTIETIQVDPTQSTGKAKML